MMNDERVTSSDIHLDVGYRSTSSAIRGDTKPLLRPNYFLMKSAQCWFWRIFQYLTYHSNIYYSDDWHFCRMCQLFFANPLWMRRGCTTHASEDTRKTHLDSWPDFGLEVQEVLEQEGLPVGTLSLCVCACCGGNFRCISMAFWASHQLMRSVDLWSAFRRMWRSHPQGPSVPRNFVGSWSSEGEISNTETWFRL